MTIAEFRTYCKLKAAERGHTLEEEVYEMERFTGSKGYADCLRLLYGIPTKS